MSLPDEALQEMLGQALQALRAQYENPYYTGDFMFVLQPLNNRRLPPRISRSLHEVLRAEKEVC